MSITPDLLSHPPLAEGKTKRIFAVPGDSSRVCLIAKDDLTAGNGAKHDVLAGKAKYANQTTCNVFALLKMLDVPVAYESHIIWENVSDTGIPPTYGFVAPRCKMLPYEVVVRREVHGSYLKRAPHLTKGYVFADLLTEVFLKTNGKKWKNYDLVCDDPLMVYGGGAIALFDPTVPNPPENPAKPFLVLPEEEAFTWPDEEVLLFEMGRRARHIFRILERQWAMFSLKLVDFKVEFGIDEAGQQLLLADVIDNDSWRLVNKDGEYMDKQVYRDGGDLNTVRSKYEVIAELTSRFCY